MGEQTESWIAKLGLDYASVISGLKAVEDAQRNSGERMLAKYKALSESEKAIAQQTMDAKLAAYLKEQDQLDASFARYKTNLEKMAAADQAYIDSYAAKMAEKNEIDSIGRGSGAFGSVGGMGRGGRSGAAGMAAGTAAMELASGGGWKEAAESAAGIAGGIHIMHAVDRWEEGKNPLAGLARIPHAIMEASKFIVANVKSLSLVGLALTADYAGLKNLKDYVNKKHAAADAISNPIYEREKSTLDAALHFDGKAAVDAEDAKSRADLEAKMAESARAASVAAEDKLESEKYYTKLKEEQVELENKLANLQREKTKLQGEAMRVDSEIPTVGNLAGRGFVKSLDKAYGAGGRFDLGTGEGYLGNAARESLLAGKQMQYDLTAGNGGWVDGKDGQPGHFTGMAEQDRRRKITADNILGRAGLDTPEMKMEAIKEHLDEINGNMARLVSEMIDHGLKLKDE